MAQVPYARLNWWDRDEGLTGRGLGEALLLFLTAEVDGTTHWADLYADLEGRGIPTGLLEAVEPGGYLPTDLHAALLDGPREAAAWYCAWVWEDTGSVFLDVSDDVAGDHAFAWTDAAVAELERQWREAKRILDGIAALEGWLEADSPRHFAALVAAISGGAIGQPEQEQGGAAG